MKSYWELDMIISNRRNQSEKLSIESVNEWLMVWALASFPHEWKINRLSYINYWITIISDSRKYYFSGANPCKQMSKKKHYIELKNWKEWLDRFVWLTSSPEIKERQMKENMRRIHMKDKVTKRERMMQWKLW